MTDIKNGINTDAIKAFKKALRITVKDLQRGLTPEYVEYADRQICLNILSMDEYKSAQAVFCFVGTKDEIDTTAILQQALDDGKKLLVPKCRPKNVAVSGEGEGFGGAKTGTRTGAGTSTEAVNTSAGIMDVFEITSLEQLEPGAYGILEPREGCPMVEPGEIDFGVIPCVSCDKAGHRLGHGGGYYDRYLEMAEKQVKSLGKKCFPRAVICRERLMTAEVPAEATDQKMDFVVNEVEIIGLATEADV